MKILFVVTDLNWGGITTSVINFCNELHERGHDVTLLDMSDGEKNNDDLKSGIEIKHLQGLEKYWRLSLKSVKNAKGVKKVGLLLLGTIKKLTVRLSLWHKIIFKKRKDSYDVAVAFRQCAPCYYYVLKKVNADKKIGFVHGEVEHMGGAEKTFIKFMPQLDRIAYVAEAVKNGFIDKYPILKNNACTVYNIFDATRIKALAEEGNPYKFDKNVVNIVTVARISNVDKRVNWVMQITDNLIKLRCRPFHWYLVGDGIDMEGNIKLAEELKVQDHITFTGKLDNPFSLLKDADFLVLTSKTEAYPMTIIEAYILKKPVITTAFSSAKEVVSDGENGYIANHDLEDLTAKIYAMINDENGAYTSCKEYLSSYEYSSKLAYDQFIDAITGVKSN